ncbi:MAG TPA: fibronectin type III domain-containing protein, partial [bacterium]|nr:fibronectin type III domain-containing protein [bacterium]
GVTGKYILRNIAGYNAQAFGGDAGVLITPLDHLRVGLVILNVGQNVQFISAADPLPTTARLGLAYQVLDIPHHSLLLSADNGYQLGSQAYIGSAGAEYWYDKTLALRVGYTGDAYQQHMTAGVGVNVDIVEFDYAYAPMGTLGDTHRFSLIARLGPEELQGLAAPTGFAARPTDGAVALSWKPAASSDVVGYNLYVKKPGSDKLALVNRRPLNDTSVKLNHLLNGQAYAFALTSVSAAGRESGVVQLSAVPGGSSLAAAPSLMAPTGFKVALDGEGFALLWDASGSSDVAGYNLYMADDTGKPGKKLTAQPTTDTKIVLKKVDPSKIYSFLLTTVGKSGAESPMTPVLKVSLADLKNAVIAQLVPPSHLALQAAEGKVHLTWDAAAGAMKYNLYLSHDGTDFKLLTPTGITKTEATLGPLKAGVAYYFGVSAVSADGKESQKAVQSLPAQ